MGMNLFNLASSLVYDPWHPDGPVLELKYFTEHLFDFGFAQIPEIEPNNVAGEATPIRPGEYVPGRWTQRTWSIFGPRRVPRTAT